ncbi:histidine kinase [Burkholderia paludis]|uniref:response regulator n=1 Tax=Burkholderia paludis TaxID=1506587 RepID=UPI0004DB917F|nr:response regulator [Burkholderia paludis]KFG95095.1 histidine kinase [Burkholderia paludis]
MTPDPVSRLSGTPLRVLVVDDIDASRAALAALVRRAGHAALEAASGMQALELSRVEPVDLVLLDLLMPDMDGFEVTRALRESHQGAWLPIIVMSSMQGDDHFVRAIQCGADDYLVKPVDPALLDAKIRNLGRVLFLQTRIAELAAHNRELFDHVEDAVLTVDRDERIRDANAAACGLLGIDALPPDGLALATLGATIHGEPWRPDARRATCEIDAKRPDGTIFPAEVRMSRWRNDPAGRVSVLVRDLTEQRRLERLKDDFLSTVSHELRTPLTSVSGAVDLLVAGAAGELPAAAQKLLDVAKRNGERLGRLIDDVLDVAKLEADRVTLQLSTHALDTLLDETAAANADYARRFGVAIGRVGPASGAIVRVDADRFLQVMANLLSNAVKHSPAGAQVDLRTDRSGDRVRIAVRDRGPGVPDAFRARIFEKFSQADDTDRRVGTGTGLGLHITRVLIERMQGRVGLTSATGRGAEFHIDLPCCDAEGRIVPMRRVAPRVVVIDRDAAARSRLGALLSMRYDVCLARTLDDAVLPRPDGPAPALVICDPQGAGTALDTVAARLAAIAGPAPVLLYTDAVPAPQAHALTFAHLAKREADNDMLLTAIGRAIGPEGGPHR